MLSHQTFFGPIMTRSAPPTDRQKPSHLFDRIGHTFPADLATSRTPPTPVVKVAAAASAPTLNPLRPGEAGIKLVRDQSQRAAETKILEGLGVPSRFLLEFLLARSPAYEDIGSGSEVNRLVSEVPVEGLPAVDFSYGDLTSAKQRPEQHGRSFGPKAVAFAS